MVAYAQPRPTNYVTPDEYLKAERDAPYKSQYFDGVIVPMPGASYEHNAIVYDLNTEMGVQLRKSPCQGFSGDMIIRVPECSRYFYPDGVAVCGKPEVEKVQGVAALVNPTVLFEVLSPTTEKTDREEKFDCYDTLASLQTYVLIAQDQPRVEVYERQPDGLWRREVVKGLEAEMRLPAVGCALKLAEIYARVEFAPPIALAVEPDAPEE